MQSKSELNLNTDLQPVGGFGEDLRRGAQQAADDLDGGVSQWKADIGSWQKVLQLRHQLIHLAGVQVGHISGQIEQRVGLAVDCGYLKQML